MRRRHMSFDALIALFGAVLVSLASASLSPAAAQGIASWTLTKTASPTTYSTVGQVINYSYKITNTGTVTIGSTTITDNKVATVTCPNFGIVAPASTLTCTGTYAITASDISAGSVTNVATAEGQPFCEWCFPIFAEATTTITYQAPVESSITIVKKAISGSGTFTFVSPTPALAVSLTTGGTASKGPITLAPGSYSISELQNIPFFALSDISCNDPDGGTSVNSSPRR